jgi:hypothetical protein
VVLKMLPPPSQVVVTLSVINQNTFMRIAFLIYYK